MKTVAVYVRTSLTTQNLDRQIFECTEFVRLRGLGEVTLYQDQSSGTKVDKRPGFQQLMKTCRLGKHSHVVVLTLCRFARSTKDLLNSIHELEESGTKFVSVNNDIDLSTSSGRLILTVLGAVSTFEAEIIKERVRSGMKAAKRKGIHLGRPRNDLARSRAQALIKKGISQRMIAKQLKVSKGFVSKAAELMKAV
jgi:putative DNA-invertase from lambdoid prophage Rac